MGILNIAPAERAGMKLLISLYGMSETGKTYSALQLMAGMEPNPSKRALLDTEGGQRGRAYVDHVPGGYLYASLTPPFTPDRYRQAIDEIEAAGVNILVVDSISHAWFAEGGVLDMVDSSQVKNDLGKWIEPKKKLRRMTNRMLSSNMHIILCARGKEPMIEGVSPDTGRKTLTKGPVVPIQEKSLRFDMTVMGLMLGDGRFTVTAPAGKCPGPLRPIFAAGEVMNEDMGKKLAAWVAGAATKTAEQRKWELDATGAAEVSVEAFRSFWAKLAKDGREHLKPMMGNYQSIAQAADDEAERQRKDVAAAHAAGEINERPFGAVPPAPSLSPDAIRAMTTLRACATEPELDDAWQGLPIEVCREIGAELVETIRAGIVPQQPADTF